MILMNDFEFIGLIDIIGLTNFPLPPGMFNER